MEVYPTPFMPQTQLMAHYAQWVVAEGGICIVASVSAMAAAAVSCGGEGHWSVDQLMKGDAVMVWMAWAVVWRLRTLLLMHASYQLNALQPDGETSHIFKCFSTCIRVHLFLLSLAVWRHHDVCWSLPFAFAITSSYVGFCDWHQLPFCCFCRHSLFVLSSSR
jgi:hypothetical protein